MAKGAGQKGRKLGRMANWCKAYAASGTVDKNRTRRMRRHLASFPNDERTRERYGENANGHSAQRERTPRPRDPAQAGVLARVRSSYRNVRKDINRRRYLRQYARRGG